MCTEESIPGRSTSGHIVLAFFLALALFFLLSPATVFAKEHRGETPEDNVTHHSGHPPGRDEPIQDRWQLLRPNIVTYIIQPGDNDWSIAQRFDLDIDTLRFSNAWMRRNPDLIHPGKEVIILPIKGAYHVVKAGDTLESIGQRYGVAPVDIVDFPLNNLSNQILRPDQKLVIPGGRLNYADNIRPPGPGRGYPLAWPLRGTVTQGFHSGHRALDIGNFYGTRVYASEAGRVSYARFSSGGWLGFTVTIAHANGLSTRYSHLSGIFVEAGQWVSRGEVIGQVGSTGNSTGPHVHFETISGGAKVNPWNYLPSSPAN